jgi:hypothetical protein
MIPKIPNYGAIIILKANKVNGYPLNVTVMLICCNYVLIKETTDIQLVKTSNDYYIRFVTNWRTRQKKGGTKFLRVWLQGVTLLA